MPYRQKHIEPVLFQQITSKISSSDFNEIFDISIIDAPDNESYCRHLIYKVFSLKHSKICDFIAHHFELTFDGLQWLNKFDKLLTLNVDLFDDKSAELRLFKFTNCIEDKRFELKIKKEQTLSQSLSKRLINAESEDRYFSFSETKVSVDKMQSENAKILFLTSEILEYQEADIIMHNKKLSDYDESCKRLIKKIKKLAQLHIELQLDKSVSSTSTMIREKIRLNGPQNILTNAMKQMMFDLKPSGHPYIQGKISDMAIFICDNFSDENGNSLSFDTIRTYLSPTRNDKDPNLDNQVKF